MPSVCFYTRTPPYVLGMRISTHSHAHTGKYKRSQCSSEHGDMITNQHRHILIRLHRVANTRFTYPRTHMYVCICFEVLIAVGVQISPQVAFPQAAAAATHPAAALAAMGAATGAATLVGADGVVAGVEWAVAAAASGPVSPWAALRAMLAGDIWAAEAAGAEAGAVVAAARAHSTHRRRPPHAHLLASQGPTVAE